MKKTLRDGRVLDVTHKMLIEFNVTRVFVGLTTAEVEEINADMAVCEETAKKAAKLSDALEVKAIKFDNAHNEGVIGGGYNPYR